MATLNTTVINTKKDILELITEYMSAIRKLRKIEEVSSWTVDSSEADELMQQINEMANEGVMDYAHYLDRIKKSYPGLDDARDFFRIEIDESSPSPQDVYNYVTEMLKKNPMSIEDTPLMKELGEFIFGKEKDENPAADDYERFLVTGRGTILVPRSKSAIANKKEIGEFIEWKDRRYKITGLEINRTLMSNPKEISRAYKVIDLTGSSVYNE